METNSGFTLECKCQLTGGGDGTITITDNMIFWKRSKANFLAFGIFTLLLKKDQIIPIDTILLCSEYSMLGGAGLEIFTRDGKRRKFGFVYKKDRDLALEHIRTKTASAT